MKTVELAGAYLDYFTGLADGKPKEKLSIRRVPRTDTLICVYNGIVRYDPSTDPEKGVDLMERWINSMHYDGGKKMATTFDGVPGWGANYQEAVCRAIVTSAIGREVPDIEITE